MSIIIETWIICDNCGESFGVDNRTLTGFNQRKEAKENGWLYSGNKDYCPNCWPSKTPRPNPESGMQLKFQRVLNQYKFNGKIKIIEQFNIEWPDNALHGKNLLRTTTMPDSGSGRGRKRRIYQVPGSERQFITMQSIINHFKNR